MGSWSRIAANRRRFESPITAISGGSIILSVDENFAHSFAAIIFYADADGTTEATPTAGTATITVETDELPNVFQPITNGVITASNPESRSFASNATRVQVVFASVTGASHAKLVVNSNLS